MPTISDLTSPAGRLEALLEEPASGEAGLPPRAAVVFAHPHPQYGGTMHTKAVYQGAKGLARTGCAVLRFNFRGVGQSQGTFDSGAGEMEDFRAALDYLAARYPGTRLWAAGFSFGSWVALEVGAADDRVTGPDRHRPARGHLGLGHELRVHQYAGEHEAEVLRPGGSRRGLSPRGRCGRSTPGCTSPRNWW